MTRLVIAIFLFCAPALATAQVGNEWIQFNQQYYKIPVGKEGLYKLTFANLQAAGLPVSADPRKFQLFHRGIEQAIHVEGQADGNFGASDFIEFYGRRNDGTQDTELYKTPASQPHKLYNLYSDTTSYFLTVGSMNGKRMAVSSETRDGLPPETFHYDERIRILKIDYSRGRDYGDIQNSVFEDGEGWMGKQIVQGERRDSTVQGVVRTVPGAGQPILEVRLTGRGFMDHAVEVYAGPRLITTINFPGYNSYTLIEPLLWSDVNGAGIFTLGVRVLGVGGAADRVSVGYIRIRYPQETDMASAAEKVLWLAPNAGGKSYLELKNAAAATKLYDVTDPNTVVQISTTGTTTLAAVVPSTQSTRKLWAGTSTVISAAAIKKVTFRNIIPSAHDYIIITHPLLRKPALGYSDPVKALAEYRALPEGGEYDTLIVNIQQLYDQFNYGEQSPLAIYRFAKFLNQSNTPKYLFLVGKGLEVNYKYYRNPSAFPVYKDLVPTAGYPASDMLFSAPDGTTPTISTGRIPAVTPQEVVAYFNKLKEAESRPFDDLRRKNILHLSGGIYEGEPQLFRSYLEGFAGVAKSYYLGGQVKAIAKQSTDIEVINVAEELNKGLNMITFFGHSATASSDFDIGLVTDPVMGYNNKGKYPLILMNGCSAGSFFLNQAIFGENWINTPDRGAIGMIAHSAFGFASALQLYSGMFYQIGYGDENLDQQGVGDVQKRVASRYINELGVSPMTVAQVQQMILLGDPAAKLFGARYPDYAVQSNTVTLESFDGEPVTALSDSFKLNVVVHNFGKAVAQDYTVEITRTLSDNSTVVYDSTFAGILYSDTIRFVLPGNIDKGYGNNSFLIRIDAQNNVDELREDNNTATVGFFIPLSGTNNLYPDNYAIVQSPQVNLTFQHTDPLAGEREFLLELDTVPEFTSAFKKQFVVRATVLATQAVTLLEQDTLVYYWRTRLAQPGENESVEWDRTSFTFIHDGPAGWAQVHFPQLIENASVGLVNDPELRRIHFEETTTDIAVKTFGSMAPGQSEKSVSLKINKAEYNIYSDAGGQFGCRNNTINLVAFDKKTTQPYPGIYLTWVEMAGRITLCGREPYVINSFRADELNLSSKVNMARYVDNVAEGDSVILFNIGNPGFSTWPAAVKAKLGELGISTTQINSLVDGEPVVIFTRKGSAPGTAMIHKTSSSPANTQTVEVAGTITGRFTSATMTSGPIGPAKQWHRLQVQYTEKEASDDVLFDIIGINLNNEETVLYTDITTNRDIAAIDADAYPYLKVVYRPSDPTLVTAAQLKKWIVTYVPVAEGLLLYKGPHDRETVAEGQAWEGDYRFVNISDQVFDDSLQVKYELVNRETLHASAYRMKIQPPAPGDTTAFRVAVGTESHAGLNTVQVFVNPKIEAEENYDNNVIVLNSHLEVIADDSAPVLDITVDGRHIRKDEFVSPDPDIRIMLWDNNPYLLKKDTAGMSLLMAYPCPSETCAFKRIHFSAEEIRWQAETDTSEFRVTFRPTGLPDGRYVLRVEGNDETGNASGDAPYEIIFQVKNELTLDASAPYPNPFADKTHFQFMITGDALPTAFSLEILNLNGRRVHHFSEEDVRSFHIGTNTITWVATDLQGNPLPAGVYVFRTALRVNDRIVTRQGKLVLVR